MSHPLDGCRAKFQRAEETLEYLGREITTFLNQEPPPYTIVKQHQDNGLEYAFIAHGDPDPPLRFAVLAGEIIHHLRSSLDHLVHASVIQNGKTPTKRHQFPICTTPEAFKDACSRGWIDGVGPIAEKLIASVQPFTTPTPDDTVLHVVSQYDNIDKHRLLVVVTTIVKLGNTITIGVNAEIAARPERQGKTPNIVGFGDPAPRKLSEKGVVVFTICLAEPAPELTAEAKLELELAFEQCGRVKLAPVVRTLRGLVAGTRHTVEKFAKEF